MASSLTNAVVARTESEDLPFKLLFGAAACCFVGALVTDVVYARAPDMVWVTFSVWLITIGLILAAIAVVAGAIDRLARRRFALLWSRWPYVVGFAAASVVELFNAFVHSRDAYEAVVPDGITLSLVAVAILALTPIAARVWLRSSTRKSI